MPHKRAKRSARDSERHQRGSDHAPSSSNSYEEPISKRAAWVLGAEKVRKEWREKKRLFEQDGHDHQDGSNKRRKKSVADRNETNGSLPHRILPGETLGQFNRRVEDDLRPTVRAAIKSSSQTKRVKKADKTDTPTSPKKDTAPAKDETPLEQPKRRMTKTEFESRPKTTRLNDIAMAPPTLNQATRKAPQQGSAKSTILSAEQKEEMEAERERVIRRYREMKEAKRIENEEKKRPPPKRMRVQDDET